VPDDVHPFPARVIEHDAPYRWHVFADDTSSVGRTASIGEFVDGDGNTVGMVACTNR
jgi:hypothetical protein